MRSFPSIRDSETSIVFYGKIISYLERGLFKTVFMIVCLDPGSLAHGSLDPCSDNIQMAGSGFSGAWALIKGDAEILQPLRSAQGPEKSVLDPFSSNFYYMKNTLSELFTRLPYIGLFTTLLYCTFFI